MSNHNTEHDITISSVVHYIVDDTHSGTHKHCKIISCYGQCNGRCFGIITIHRSGEGANGFSFVDKYTSCEISKSEFVAIRKSICKISVVTCEDYRGGRLTDDGCDILSHLIDEMEKKFYGSRIYFDVPREQIGRFQQLDGVWDAENNRWFAFDKNPNIDAINAIWGVPIK